ncbi:hypothetical protein [Anaerorhabdus sp.]|uniref:hypothetical protein n=1 Tax=Anaerorhabdus sp. TaxID=1872524 RepID=UPI002FC6E0FC
MDQFATNLNKLIGNLTDKLLEISTPILILVAIAACLGYAISSQQNRDKYKFWLIGIIVITILVVSMSYIIPWLQAQFAEAPQEAAFLLSNWRI